MKCRGHCESIQCRLQHCMLSQWPHIQQSPSQLQTRTRNDLPTDFFVRNTKRAFQHLTCLPRGSGVSERGHQPRYIQTLWEPAGGFEPSTCCFTKHARTYSPETRGSRRIRISGSLSPHSDSWQICVFRPIVAMCKPQNTPFLYSLRGDMRSLVSPISRDRGAKERTKAMSMNPGDRIARHRLSILDLAQALGNVSVACRLSCKSS